MGTIKGGILVHATLKFKEARFKIDGGRGVWKGNPTNSSRSDRLIKFQSRSLLVGKFTVSVQSMGAQTSLPAWEESSFVVT